MITRNYDHRGEAYLTAIGIVPHGNNNAARGVKYRKIRNQETKLYRFERFLRTAHPGITHVNYYGRRTKSFVCQRVLVSETTHRTEYVFRRLPTLRPLQPKHIPEKGKQGQPKNVFFALTHSIELRDIHAIYLQHIPW